MVTVFGQQTLNGDGMEQEDVELVQAGEYFERNGAKYLFFDETHEGMAQQTRNMLKLREGYLEVKKQGVITTTMIFEMGKRQSMTYTVPYGSFLVETYTTEIQLHEEEDCLDVEAAYTLFINGAHTADCSIRIRAQSREAFHLE